MNFFTVLHMLLVCFVAECLSIQCQEALGMENRKIADGQISASSQWDANHAAHQGRLNFQPPPGKAGSWSARTNNVNQWLQIDFRKNTKITDVATQGRKSYDQWVTRYKLQYSVNGVNFPYYTEQQVEMEFVGNIDQDTVVNHTLTNPIIARYIRFRPTAWHGHISMRVEVFGPCAECQDALGMENGAISDGQISASSQWDANHAAHQGRLNFQAVPGKAGSWSARTNNVNQWLQIDFGKNTKVVAVATQGRNGYDQWVTGYKLQHSVNDVNFPYYTEQQVEKEFVGNADQGTVVYHELSNPIIAIYIRFRPTAWHGHISMRVEVFGCKAPVVSSEECLE